MLDVNVKKGYRSDAGRVKGSHRDGLDLQSHYSPRAERSGRVGVEGALETQRGFHPEAGTQQPPGPSLLE